MFDDDDLDYYREEDKRSDRRRYDKLCRPYNPEDPPDADDEEEATPCGNDC